MAISTLAELKTATTNWLHRADLASYVEDLIMVGEKWIFRHARCRLMESSLSVAISSGVAAVPEDFLALKNARISGSPSTPLVIRPPEWIYDQYPNRGGGELPKFVGVEGANLVFGPYPSAYTVVGTYYARPASVISSANTLFTTNPDLYLFAALAEAELFLKNDKRVLAWISRRDAILDDVNREDRAAKGGDGMAVRVA